MRSRNKTRKHEEKQNLKLEKNNKGCLFLFI